MVQYVPIALLFPTYKLTIYRYRIDPDDTTFIKLNLVLSDRTRSIGAQCVYSLFG